MNNNQFLKILRWIIFIPGAIVAAYLVGIIFFLLNKTSDLFFSSDNIWNLIMGYISNILMGLAFILAGRAIAPQSRKTVSIILFGLSCAVVAIGIFSTFLVGFSWHSFISEICLLIGSSYAFYLSLNEID